MGINVSTSMGFENKDFLRERAKQILKKGGAEEEKAGELVKNINFNSAVNKNAALNILAASSQVTLNNSLKETLNYLKAHANDKRKQYILGELWEKLDNFKGSSNGELIDFEIDYNLKNIFAA